ncbi:hypothetical protein [Nonomuraea sp. NPDC050310]|uniref:hypothetical protein n=1 Tax=Nonomuraea sp. NPDC050310 TaxID=3154935 RepID=UPI003411E45C
MRRIAAFLLAALSAGLLATLSPTSAAAGSAGFPAAAAATPSGRVALIGVPGLAWSDLSAEATPTLWKLVAEGASASLSTRTVPPPDRGVTCPVQGWLTVSAGQRAGSPGRGCALPPTPTGTTVPGWAELSTYQSTTGYDARLGTLGQLTRDAGAKVLAIGPGAALGAADTTGTVDSYADSPDQAGDLTPYRLIVMEAPELSTAWIAQPRDELGFPAGLTPDARRAAVVAADQRIAALLQRLPQGTTVLVAGVSDTSVNAHLHVALASGPPYKHAYLTASSTRQDGLVTITDLTATVLHLLGVDQPSSVVGRVWENGGPAPATAAETASGLADQDLASQVLRDVRGPFFAVFVTVQLLFYVLAAIAFRRRTTTRKSSISPADAPGDPSPTDRGAVGGVGPTDPARAMGRADLAGGPSGGVAPMEDAGAADEGGHVTGARVMGGAGAVDSGIAGAGVLRTVQVVAVVSGSIAVATFLAQLVPWWNFPAPMLGVIATILGFAGLVTLLAFAGPWRGAVLGPLTIVAGITSLTLLIDVMTGSALQINAVTGYEPVTGGRFYGFSNIAFAVYATGTILALAGVAQWLLSRGVSRLVTLLVCAAYGGLAVFADGWPAWGADFGGVPAFVVGLAVFLILLTGQKVSLVKLLLVGLAGAALIGALAFFDWLRPATQRTHLGTFVQQILDGTALTVVGRKFSAMVGVTVGNWSLTLLSLVALAFLFFVLNRPSRWGASALGQAYALAPPLRAGLFGALTCALIGFLMNDSGIAIPAMALTVAVPLALAAAVRALQLAKPTTPARPSAPAGSTAPPAA